MNTSVFSLFSTALLAFAAPAVSRAGIVSGRVSNDAGQPIAAASVLLLRSTDSALIKTELTDEKGEYHLTPIPDGKYLISVVTMGYDNYLSSAFAVGGASTNAPAIVLHSTTRQLGTVTVKAQKPMVEVRPDKLVMNVENSLSATGSTALELLARAPGVTVDNNDNISLKGKQGITVMINGKQQPLSGQELANMLKSMPADMIGQIELISNPSARYDAAGTAGIINIKLKKDKKQGLNGSVNATYAQGIYGKTNWSGNLNYRTKKLNLYTTYNGSNREGFNTLTLNRTFTSNGQFAGAYVQTNNYLYNISNEGMTAGADYNVTAKTTIGAGITGDVTDFRRTGYNYSLVQNAGQPDRHFITTNGSPNTWRSGTTNINLRHTFDSSGSSLTADADYAIYPNSGAQDFTTTWYRHMATDTLPLPPTTMLNGDLTGITQIRSAKADYTTTLPKGIGLEAGAKMSYVTAEHDLKFYNQVNEQSVADTGRTNHFLYREQISAAYLTLKKDFTGWSTQIGLRAEQTNIKGDASTLVRDSSFTRRYGQLFPSVAVQRHIDKRNDVGLTLSRRIERPNYEQLNPSTYYLDPTTYKTGDPYLLPALSYSAELSWIHNQRFVTNLNYTNTQRPITEVLQPAENDSRITVQTQKNLIRMEYYGINGSYQIPIAKWWTNTTSANVWYAHYTGDVAGTNLSKGRMAWDVNCNNSFTLPANYTAELGGFYQAPQLYGYMYLRPQWMLNMGIQKTFLNRKAVVRLNATDVFWRGFPRATSDYNNYTESFVARRDTRQVSLSFTYRFGQRPPGGSTRHRGGAEDEQRRAGKATG
jgi:hypothetical protein